MDSARPGSESAGIAAAHLSLSTLTGAQVSPKEGRTWGTGLFIRVFLSCCRSFCFAQLLQTTPKGALFYNAWPTHSFGWNEWDVTRLISIWKTRSAGDRAGHRAGGPRIRLRWPAIACRPQFWKAVVGGRVAHTKSPPRQRMAEWGTRSQQLAINKS